MKREVIDSSLKMKYFFIEKDKKALEIVYLYLNDKNNVDSYRTNFFFGEQKEKLKIKQESPLKTL